MEFAKKCRKNMPQLLLYVSGEAEEPMCWQIERHLAECNHCRIVVDTLQKTIFFYRALEAPEIPASVHHHLCQCLQIDLPPKQEDTKQQ